MPRDLSACFLERRLVMTSWHPGKPTLLPTKGFPPSGDQDSLTVLGVSKDRGSRCGFWTDTSIRGTE